MGDFNRGRSGRERNYSRPSFNNRGSGRPIETHKAVCGKCGKDCEVPFRPTNGKPVYCSSCFENNRNSERSNNFEDREMFAATCADCGNSCEVPFRPTNGKPVFCSNCFGDKKEGGSKRGAQSSSQPQYEKQFEQLNNKLDKILTILLPDIVTKAVQNQQPEEQSIDTDKKTKVVKKKSSKKKK